jgi:hypothetical protein
MSVEIDTVTDQKLQTILLPTPSDPYKLDRISAIMFDDLWSIPKNRGGIDYKPEHDGKRKRQKDDGTAVDLTVPMEDYHECVRLVREYRRAHPLE